MTQISVGFVGAGRRVQDLYLPILRALSGEFAPVAVVSRSPTRVASLASDLGLRVFPTVGDMCSSMRPQLVVIATGPASNGALALDAIGRGCVVLVETPCATSAAAGRRIAAQAVRRGTVVGVAEQKPFLPLESFKRLLIDAGAVGRVSLVENSFRSRGSHAIAQLRRYLAPGVLPVSVRSTRLSTPLDAFVTTAGAHEPAGAETWTLAQVVFADGSTAIHQFSSAFKAAPFRIGQSLRVFGSRGSIVGSDMAISDPSGVRGRLSIDMGEGRLTPRLSTRLPDGRDVVWQSPVSGGGLDDDQLALAEHLLAMRNAVLEGGRPLYSLHDALVDLDILEAAERSERGGGVSVLVNHRCADSSCRALPGSSLARARVTQWARAAAVAGPWYRLLAAARRAGG